MAKRLSQSTSQSASPTYMKMWTIEWHTYENKIHAKVKLKTEPCAHSHNTLAHIRRIADYMKLLPKMCRRKQNFKTKHMVAVAGIYYALEHSRSHGTDSVIISLLWLTDWVTDWLAAWLVCWRWGGNWRVWQELQTNFFGAVCVQSQTCTKHVVSLANSFIWNLVFGIGCGAVYALHTCLTLAVPVYYATTELGWCNEALTRCAHNRKTHKIEYTNTHCDSPQLPMRRRQRSHYGENQCTEHAALIWPRATAFTLILAKPKPKQKHIALKRAHTIMNKTTDVANVRREMDEKEFAWIKMIRKWWPSSTFLINDRRTGCNFSRPKICSRKQKSKTNSTEKCRRLGFWMQPNGSDAS